MLVSDGDEILCDVWKQKRAVLQGIMCQIILGQVQWIPQVLLSLTLYPVECRIQYYILVISCHALSNEAPEYVCKLLYPYNNLKSLRAANGCPLETEHLLSLYVKN